MCLGKLLPAYSFTKVAAYTNVKYNELADQTAKKDLRKEWVVGNPPDF